MPSYSKENVQHSVIVKFEETSAVQRRKRKKKKKIQKRKAKI